MVIIDLLENDGNISSDIILGKFEHKEIWIAELTNLKKVILKNLTNINKNSITNKHTKVNINKKENLHIINKKRIKTLHYHDIYNFLLKRKGIQTRTFGLSVKTKRVMIHTKQEMLSCIHTKFCFFVVACKVYVILSNLFGTLSCLLKLSMKYDHR